MTARVWGLLVPALLISLSVLPVAAQESRPAAESQADYAALADPRYANQLELTDEQRASIATILDDRVAALAAAKPEERPQIVAESNRQLEELLSAGQREKFQELTAGGKLRFNFRQQQWPDVLDWFARQADLSLVMDASPPGTFTYSDDKEHTATQAIDLLNSVLLSKGFALVRREQMLLVIDVTEGVPFELVPQIELDELPKRGRFELVTVEIPLEGRPVEACVAAVQGLIGKHGRVTPLAAAGKLLITETAGKLRAVNLLIASIPVPKPAAPPTPPAPPPAPPVFASYLVKGLDVAATVATLKDLFTSATVKPDPVAEEVHVFAPPPVQAAVKEALDKMLINAKGDNRPHLEIYPVETADLAQLQTQLTAAVPQARITVDQTQCRLLVIANDTQHAEVRHALEKLGVETAPEKTAATFAIYKVARSGTAALVTLLQQALPRATVISQPGRIAVRAWPHEHELVKKMIDDLEKLETDALESPTRTLKFYPVSETQKKRFQAVLPELQSELSSLKVLLDASPKEIAVWADPLHHEALAGILAELRGTADDRNVSLHRFPIRVADPARLLSMAASRFPESQLLLNEKQDALLVWDDEPRWEAIRQELEKLTEVLPAKEDRSLEAIPVPGSEASAILAAAKSLIPAATVSLDSTNRRLIVIGTAEEHQQAKDLAAKLSGDAEKNSSVLIGYALKQTDAAAVVKMLQDLRPDVRFGADQRANRVLVTAPLKEHTRLRAVIEELDAPPDARLEDVVRKYPLKMMSPSTVVTLIQPLVPGMKLTADAATRQILATGTELAHHKLEELLQRIDGDEASPAEVRTYDVGAADSEQVRNVLLQLVPSAVISATKGVPKLLVWAGEADHALIKEAVLQFTEQSPDQSRRLEIYPYEQKIGSATLSVLQSIVPGATLSLDASGKQLIAWATAKQQDDVKRALERFAELQSKSGDRVLRTHAVRDDLRSAIRRHLASAIDGIEYVDIAATDQLVCWASEADQTRIDGYIRQFERELKQSGERILQVHKLEKTAPAAATTVLNESLKNLTFLTSPDASQLLILGTAEQHRRVDEILQQVEEASRSPQTILKVYPVDRDRMTARMMVSALGSEETAGAVIQVNPETNSLVVRAEEPVHARLAAAMAVLLDQLPAAKSETQVYRLKRGSPATALNVLTPLLPQARLAVDEKAGTLVATASAADHERIRTVVDQMDDADQDASLVTRIYRFRKISATTVQSAFQNLAPGARVAADANANVVIATASEADHQAFREAAEKLDGQPGGSIVRVYPFVFGQVSAATILSFLDRDLKDSVSIQLNEGVNSLIVRGDEESHAKFRQAVDSLVTQIPAPTGKVTQVYALKHAAAELVQRTIAPLIPSGTAVADAANSSLLVTATEYDQQRIADVIGKLDTVPAHQRVMRPYPIRHADATAVYQTVSQGFSQNAEYSVTFQPATGTLFVLASPKNHETFRQLLAELDQPGEVEQKRIARNYRLGNVTGSAAAAAVRALYQGRNVTVELDSKSNTLVVVADEAQHKTVAETLKQFEGEEREFRVFELWNTDVFVAENAIRDLFEETGGGKFGPSVSSDFDSQKLFVRGTPAQLQQIQKLLVTLGESPAENAESRQAGDVRTIPFSGDTRAAAEQLRLIWPRMRTNRIEIITPSRSGIRSIRPAPADSPQPESGDDGRQESSARERGGVLPETATLKPQVRLAAMQDSIRPSQKAKSDGKESADDAAEPSAEEAAQPPVVIVPDEGSITIMSPDHQALDQMESLLRAMSRGEGRGRSGPNLSVFLLRNTGAADMQRILKQLVDDQRSARGEFGDVTIASDERLNALIVHGSRKSRETLQQLLEVLDTNELPAPLADQSPVLIRLQNVQARRVRTILASVYKTQLTTGGGRREVQIPKGVSPDVASVLQQINAASAGPVLSLEVDETTNSLVMRAPPELSREIRQFVEQLDQQAADVSHRNVRIIRLRQNKSDRMQQVLQQFLLQSSPQGSGQTRESNP